jgi:hypothetical protein
LPTPRFTSLQQPLPNFRGRLCCSAGQFNNQLFFLYYLWDPALFHSPELGGLNCFFISFFPLISHGNRRKKQTAPSTAKGKRKCDDTNSTYEHTRTPNNQSQYLLWLWDFFPQRVSFFLYFVRIAAWKKAEETGEHTTIEDRGGKTWKEGRMPGGTETHPRCVWQLLALSRLVRSSLSFLPSCEEGGRQNAIDDSVTGSLSRLERES